MPLHWEAPKTLPTAATIGNHAPDGRTLSVGDGGMPVFDRGSGPQRFYRLKAAEE